MFVSLAQFKSAVPAIISFRILLSLYLNDLNPMIHRKSHIASQQAWAKKSEAGRVFLLHHIKVRASKSRVCGLMRERMDMCASCAVLTTTTSINSPSLSCVSLGFRVILSSSSRFSLHAFPSLPDIRSAAFTKIRFWRLNSLFFYYHRHIQIFLSNIYLVASSEIDVARGASIIVRFSQIFTFFLVVLFTPWRIL